MIKDNLNDKPKIQKSDISYTTSNISTCKIKNCLKCLNNNECKTCIKGYLLYNNRCFSKDCSVFGFCEFCDEFDCQQCITGYKLEYGICDEKLNQLQRILTLGIGIPLLLTISIIYFCKYLRKRTKAIIESGKILGFKRPKPGNYVIGFPESQDEFGESQGIKSLYNTLENVELGDKTIKTECVICGKKKVFTFADCGCALCFEHWKIIKKEEKNDNENKFICRIHNIPLTKYIVFHLDRKSTIKGNAVDKIGLSICPVCKISDATVGFNCGCGLKLCQKCFNDNVYVLKYNQCPGCGDKYNPRENKTKNNNEIKKKTKKQYSEMKEEKTIENMYVDSINNMHETIENNNKLSSKDDLIIHELKEK